MLLVNSVQCSTVQYSAVPYLPVQCYTVHISAVQAGLPCPGRQLAEGPALQSVMYSTVQYFTVHYSAVFYSTVSCSVLQCSVLHYITVQLQYDAVLYSRVQYSAVFYSTLPCSVLQYSAVFDSAMFQSIVLHRNCSNSGAVQSGHTGIYTLILS